MADTPFELYEEAYRLHYREKNIAGAVKIYEAIMRDFPDAHECGYAFVQLQKIKANGTTARLLNREGRLGSLVIPAIVISCIALLVTFAGLIVTFRDLSAEHARSTLATAALARIAEGRDHEAEQLIARIKVMNPDDELVRELAVANNSRITVSEPVTKVKTAADSARKAAGAAAGGKYVRHEKSAGISGFRPVQHADTGKKTPPANSQTPKY